MTRSELVSLAVIAFLGWVIFRFSTGQNVPVLGNLGTVFNPGMGTLNTPVDSGGAINHSTQDAIGHLAGFPMADYSQGPNFYVQNQPWYFDPPMGGIMPMSAGSTNITGAPSAQMAALAGISAS